MLTRIQTKQREYFDSNVPYEMTFWEEFNYEHLSRIPSYEKAGRGAKRSYNDCFIMGDTETSKKRKGKENHVVAWTISIRAFERNIVTLWGRKPSDMVSCISHLITSMSGDDTYVYFHNLAYDWVFLRKFLMLDFGEPTKQLSTKTHNPILFHFSNGLILRDSLILAQRSLDKWAKDMNVEHQKALGKWEYDKLRGQYESYTDDELEYIEHDTLAGVECLDALRISLHKHVYSMPFTATGIPREESRNIGKKHNAHDRFTRMAPNELQYRKLLHIFHGGFTHANRYFVDKILLPEFNDGIAVICYDFASSYPYVMLSEKFPCERFGPYRDTDLDSIIRLGDKYAFMFKLVLIRPDLKDYLQPMPTLQYSKCVNCINPVLDNGRIICADYVEIYLNEVDASIIRDQYKWDKHICTEVEFALKAHLPRWLTDYIFQLFTDKTKLKGGDKVLYALAKAKLNSIYGMTVQRCIRDNLIEDFNTGEYYEEEPDINAYQKYLDNKNSIFPYFWGCWVTSYAFKNLFMLGKCVDYANGGQWIYSDTDSCYATKWNEFKIEYYNKYCKEKLKANGYGPVEHDGREYWLGVAEFDGAYSEYIVQGAKRYCARSVKDGELHITVAGVPKKGVKCLENDINNFRKGFIFSGDITGKLTHYYIYTDKIYIDDEGNETGDSINLERCDYLLDSELENWDRYLREEILYQVYEEE